MSADRSHDHPPPSAGKAGAPRRILIVDDHEDAASSLAILLGMAGHETHVAHDGSMAIDTAERIRPEVILLDIGLPDINGCDVCRRIREKPWGPGIMIIAMTGWDRDEDHDRTRDAGFDHHMAKPLDPEALIRLLDASPEPKATA